MARQLTEQQEEVIFQNGGMTVSACRFELSSGGALRFAAARVTDDDDNVWLPNLRAGATERRSLRRVADKIDLQVQNVDKVFGQTVLNVENAFAAARIHYGKLCVTDSGSVSFKETFTGEVVSAKVQNAVVVLSCVSDFAAAGSVAAWRTIPKICLWQYKGHNCGSNDSSPTCNKVYEHVNGCSSKDPAPDLLGDPANNQARHGGFIFRDGLNAPVGGTGGPGTGGSGGPGGGGCFLEGTPVTLADGSLLPIERCFRHTRVRSFDYHRGAVVEAEVEQLKIYRAKEYYNLVFEAEGFAPIEINATWQHPFFVGGTRFRKVEDLQVGDLAYRASDSGLLIPYRLAAKTRRRESVLVHNISVPLTGTFEAAGLIVHNDKPAPIDYLPISAARHPMVSDLALF